MKERLLQKRLFDKLKARGHRYVRKELESLLNISRSSANKRASGEIALTFDELVLVARKYQISLDQLICEESSNQVLFQFPTLQQYPTSFEAYFESLLPDMEALAQMPDAIGWYATNEIPLFHYFHFPELTAFKMFIWARTVWTWPKLQNRPFSSKTFTRNRKAINMTRRMLEVYTHIPSTEFWNPNILYNTLSQIRYYHDSDNFKYPNEASLLYEQLEGLIDRYQVMCRDGQKFIKKGRKRIPGAAYELYFNEIMNVNNHILVKSPALDFAATYTTYDNPNFMSTRDPRMCEKTEAWMGRLKKRSIRISQDNEKFRQSFFQGLKRQVIKEKKRRSKN